MQIAGLEVRVETEKAYLVRPVAAPRWDGGGETNTDPWARWLPKSAVKGIRATSLDGQVDVTVADWFVEKNPEVRAWGQQVKQLVELADMRKWMEGMLQKEQRRREQARAREREEAPWEWMLESGKQRREQAPRVPPDYTIDSAWNREWMKRMEQAKRDPKDVDWRALMLKAAGLGVERALQDEARGGGMEMERGTKIAGLDLTEGRSVQRKEAQQSEKKKTSVEQALQDEVNICLE